MRCPYFWLFCLGIFYSFKRGVSGLNCYQCDSRYDLDCKEHFDWQHVNDLTIRPTPCTVDAAVYCIKTTGVWGGIVGTTRFCSSRDMFNQCQYVTYADHNRVYRACIYTCSTDNCNGSSSLSHSMATMFTTVLFGMILVILRCWSRT